ncbi:hypothetical protein BDV95DRAFT_487680 [Massariosphaeria phaeospora]|uniref:RING-type domain-containing protein n=1 Tax=Massariosphaeria phaeospora TaxID=100035 RepID=A0A7C8IE96_9PLEO|nr:hypothetical protein BDV95DRAFT_487680 [Massariosphaeria phaeospora]
MEDFINTHLTPTEECIICKEGFSARHPPVGLRCGHIFHQKCLVRWLRNGRGNTSSCPTCRTPVIQNDRSTQPPAFNATSLWEALCNQPSRRLEMFMLAIWERLPALWSTKPAGNFTVVELLDDAIIPSLVEASSRHHTFHDAYSLIAGSWNSLGRPDSAQGLAVPLVRLARIMSHISSVMPKWLVRLERMQHIFWKANECLGMTTEEARWDCIEEAANMTNLRYFPLLYLYTIFISQNIAHSQQPKPWPQRRHEVMNFVVERCCRKIGAFLAGRASNELKEKLVIVYQELRDHQLTKGRVSLRGHDNEEDVVKGLWQTAPWRITNDAAR